MRNDDAMSDELVDGEWTKLYHPNASPPPSPSTMSRSQHSWLPRRSSVSSASSPTNATSLAKLKGKDRSVPDPGSGPYGLGSRHGHCPNDVDSNSPSARDSTARSIPPQYSASLPSRHRTSILSAASDALGFRKKIGSVSRKKPTPHSVPDHIVTEVIEINNSTVSSTVGTTSAHEDYELEERERLRDVAAQSIGLDPELLRSSKPESRSLLDSPHSPTQPVPLPSFPTTAVALRPFTQLSATLPKFNPPSSLLVYALAKQWKPRTIVLTSHTPTRKTHVHLFKGASKDDRELERLEVTEDSVIFVAEGEFGGRGNVVKLAGDDVSARFTGVTGKESLRTMWWLQIKDPAESHRWITAIKNAVLTQRAVRAGLDIPAQFDGGNEPKGDMDVMLSMHLQRIMSMHPTKTSAAISPPSSLIPTSPSPPLSLRSLNLNTSPPSTTTTMKGIFSGTRPRSPSVEGSPTHTCLPGHGEDSFSVATTSLLTMLRTKPSTDSSSSPPHSLPLLAQVPGRGSPAPSLRSTNTPVIINASDLKISKDRDAPEVSVPISETSSASTTPGSNSPPTPFILPQSTLTFSLHPPPRKSKHIATSLHEPQGLYKHANGNRSVAGNFGLPPGNPGDLTPRETPMSSDSSHFLSGQPGSTSPTLGFGVLPVVETHVNEQSDEVTQALLGCRGVDCSSSGVASVPTDKLLQSTVITKRWSRQGVPLPKQLTPPSGPPPSIPPSPEKKHRFSVESGISIPVPHAIERSPSSSSSNLHSRARISPKSGSSLSPIFWKRTSGSSTYSISSTNTSDSHIRAPFGSEPFRPASGSGVGNRTSLRPMSLSVYGSSSVVHMGTTKRRSMPPPRPAPNFAPPPAPTVQEPTPGPAPAPQKSFRSSVAQRALRLSLTSPKPPPSTALPPRPDEFTQGHRRSSSTGTADNPSISVPSSRPTSPLLGTSSPIQRTSSPPRSLSIRQRLRILSSPSVQPSSSLIPSIQVSTLDLSDDNDDDPPTPCFLSPQPFGLGEHIMTMQNDPSFLQLSPPTASTLPKSVPRSTFRPIPPTLDVMGGGLRVPPLEPGCDFIALSPPPPRKGSKPHVVTVAQAEEFEVERTGSARREESKLVALSQRGSVVSLGFVTT